MGKVLIQLSIFLSFFPFAFLNRFEERFRLPRLVWTVHTARRLNMYCREVLSAVAYISLFTCGSTLRENCRLTLRVRRLSQSRLFSIVPLNLCGCGVDAACRLWSRDFVSLKFVTFLLQHPWPCSWTVGFGGDSAWLGIMNYLNMSAECFLGKMQRKLKYWTLHLCNVETFHSHSLM